MEKDKLTKIIPKEKKENANKYNIAILFSHYRLYSSNRVK
jgi:hypothetical protein